MDVSSTMTMLLCSSKIQIDRKIASVPYAMPRRNTSRGCFSALTGPSKDSSTIFYRGFFFWVYICLLEFIFLCVNFIKQKNFCRRMEYEALLKRAREQLPESVFEKERFDIPKARGHLQGNRTVITNFMQIVTVLRRPVEHLLKYVLRELAAPGEVTKSGLLVLGTKMPAARINSKIKQYADEFVLCPKCGKPDTEITKEGLMHFLKCSACGNKNQVKSKI